jgi:hypothetical protein
MKRRYVLILVNASAVQQNLVTNFLKSNGYGFWHWSSDTWLIVSTVDNNAIQLQGRIDALLLPSRVQLLVFGVEGDKADNWAAYGPTNWGEWLRSTWE